MRIDVRTPEKARETLVRMTGVPLDVWKRYGQIPNPFDSTNELIEFVVEMNHGHLPSSSSEFEYVFFQITTSSNGCQSILRNGILNLQETYSLSDSELREFLNEHGIIINLQKKILLYGGQEFDISFSKSCPDDDTLEYKSWSVGEKFYHDFSICGFLSVWEKCAYGGQVHRRPEILYNIDKLLNTELSREWEESHSAYNVIAVVKDENVFLVANGAKNEKERISYCLRIAFDTAFGDPDEELIILNDEVRIPPTAILGIEICKHWNYLNHH